MFVAEDMVPSQSFTAKIIYCISCAEDFLLLNQMFAIDTTIYVVMSNHLRVVLKVLKRYKFGQVLMC